MGRENDVTHWNEALRLENDQLMAKITILKEEIHVMKEQYKPNSANSNVPELLEEIARLKERIYYLEQQISHGTKYRDVYEAQTSINSNTNLSPRRYDRHTRPESESDGGYGANFG
jgi:phage shock protein A